MKNIYENPKAREQVQMFFDIWKTLDGNSKSFQPMAYGKKEVVCVSRVSTVSAKGNPMDIIVWQEIGTGRRTITYTMHNKHLDMIKIQDVEPNTTWYVSHTGSNGFSRISIIDELELDEGVDPFARPKQATSNQTLYLWDIEVFMYDNLYVFLDYFTGEWIEIENDTEALKKFYLENRDSLFVGYNSVSYDSNVFRAQLQGKNPFEISQHIIKENGKDIWNKYNTKTTPLFNMDIYQDNRGFSLKEHCGFLGLDIRETEVDFEIDRPLVDWLDLVEKYKVDLNQDQEKLAIKLSGLSGVSVNHVKDVLETGLKNEKKENREYCRNDVTGTKLRLEQNIGMLLAKVTLLALYGLDKMAMGQTNANITAMVLQAEKAPARGDEFAAWELPENIHIENQEVLEGFTGHEFSKNKKGKPDIKLSVQCRDLVQKFGVGGIHGAIKSFIHTGKFWVQDVGSEYPNAMELFGLLSRNIPEPVKHIYGDILDQRMKAKYSNEKTIDVNGVTIPTKVLIEGFKLPLNTKYGAMGAEFNKLYDPRMRLLVCLVGQVAMFDLFEKIEPHAKMFQSNTDAHYFEPFSEEHEQEIDKATREWQERTGFTLDKEIFIALYQRDVNNYLAIEDNGKVKIKGGIGLTRGLKISKAIISNAFINYVLSGYDYKKFIYDCNEIRQYQIISKTGHTYDETIVRLPDGTEKPAQKVNRSYAIKDETRAVQLYKVKRGVTLDDMDLDDDWLDDDELDELEVEVTEQVGDDSYTLGIQRAPQCYTIDNKACGEGITIDEIDKEYYINEVEYLLKNWFGNQWEERLKEAHANFKAQGFEFPEVTNYID